MYKEATENEPEANNETDQEDNKKDKEDVIDAEFTDK